MIIGVPKEIKNNENRVGMTPAGVGELVRHGHKVFVQSTAGVGSGFSDSDYEDVGAIILPAIEDVYREADMIVKVNNLSSRNIRWLEQVNWCSLISTLHVKKNLPTLC